MTGIATALVGHRVRVTRSVDSQIRLDPETYERLKVPFIFEGVVEGWHIDLSGSYVDVSGYGSVPVEDLEDLGAFDYEAQAAKARWE